MIPSILYVCNEDKATTKHRLLALKEIGVKVEVIYSCLLNEKVGIYKKIWRSIKFRIGFFPERNEENIKIINKIQENKYDILFVEKGLSILPKTIKFVKKIQPNIKVISYFLDDFMNPKNNSFQFKNSISLYDFHFTNKKHNISPLINKGAKNAIYFKNAYSSHYHKLIFVTTKEKNYYGSEISFIGTYEKERAKLLRYLAVNNFKIKIWGWSKLAKKSGMQHPNITIYDHVYGEEFTKVINSSKINLCFLRKANKDTETTRSVEIPACGGFMLAERTQEHLDLFEENKEAVYFSTKEEMLEKVKYYLEHEVERHQIGLNGLNRCINDNYSYVNQLKEILTIIMRDETLSYN